MAAKFVFFSDKRNGFAIIFKINKFLRLWHLMKGMKKQSSTTKFGVKPEIIVVLEQLKIKHCKR